MKKFVEITKINQRNEEGKALIDVDSITGLCQQPKHVTRLYDENDNLVSETEDAPRFALFTNTNQVYIVSEGEYNTIKDLLTK